MMTSKFRPLNISKRHAMRERLKYGRAGNYHWQSRVEWFPAGYGFNKKTISRQFSKLHYLACHSPEPITKKWHKAYKNFYKKHFGVSGSMRYINKYSCHSWL